MNMHPAIDKWARKKYDLAPDATVKIESETFYSGYCETCSYEEERMVVYVKNKHSWDKIDDMRSDLASLLKEILDDTME